MTPFSRRTWRTRPPSPRVPRCFAAFPPHPLLKGWQSLVIGLLEKHPDNRLGGGPRDGRDVMAHPFFSGINFDKLVRREIKPPFVPTVTSDTDVTNFDPTFTSEAPKLTPPSASLAKEARLACTAALLTCRRRRRSLRDSTLSSRSRRLRPHIL